MRRIALFVLMAVLAGALVHTGHAGPDDDSMALAQRVASFIKENGRDKGIAEIMNPADRFKKGKCNVALNDFNGVNLANALFPALVGQNHYTLRDANDKPFVKESIEIAKSKGGGWMTLAFTNPKTKKIEPWKGYAQRVEGADLVVVTPCLVGK